jgi:hypothetical protein
MVIIIMKHFRKNTVMEVSVVFLGGFWGFGGGFGGGDDFWGWCYGGWGDNEMILLNLIVSNTITRYIDNSDSNSRSTDNLA